MAVQMDDNVAIQLVLQGQQSAYAALADKYRQYVFTIAMRYVNNREVAEELSQDVFVKAYRCLADFKGNSKFSTWLYTIVNTTCLSHLRKKGDAAVLLEEDKIVSLSDNLYSEHPTRLLEQKATRLLLDNAMKQLPGPDARILTLFYQAEQSVDEVGNILGITATNVKVKLFRARGKLKEILESKYSNEFV